MNVVKQHIPIGHPNRPGTKLQEVLAIVFHYTANDAPGATDTMNARYFGRPFLRINGKDYEKDGKTFFRYGSTQIIADMDSVTEAIPVDEVSWSAGDRPLPWTPQYKGQQPVAKHVFGNMQNYKQISVEICNNDAIRNSEQDWLMACENAAEWAVSYIKEKGLRVDVEGSLDPQALTSKPQNGMILLLRHHDLTSKMCPKRFVDFQEEWEDFVRDIAEKVEA